MLAIVFLLLSWTMHVGCGAPRSNTQTIGGIDFRLATVPDPPKSGRVRLEVTVTENGKPLEMAGLDASLWDTSRLTERRDLMLLPKDGKLVGLVDLYPGNWRVELAFIRGGQTHSGTFLITVEK